MVYTVITKGRMQDHTTTHDSSADSYEIFKEKKAVNVDKIFW